VLTISAASALACSAARRSCLARPRARDQHARAASSLKRSEIAGGEVDGVHLRKRSPINLGVLGTRVQALAEGRDRPLAGVIDERDTRARGTITRD